MTKLLAAAAYIVAALTLTSMVGQAFGLAAQVATFALVLVGAAVVGLLLGSA